LQKILKKSVANIDNTKDIKEVYIEFPNLHLEMEYSYPYASGYGDANRDGKLLLKIKII